MTVLPVTGWFLAWALVAAFAVPEAHQAAGRNRTRPAAGEPTVQLLKAEVERLYADWKSGRLDQALARFAANLRARTSASTTAALLQAERDRMGQYVGLEGAELRHGGMAEGRPLTVLDVTVRYARASAAAQYGFVQERGAWRLRAWGQRSGLPDDTTLPAAARALLDGVVRDGAVSLVPRFSAKTLAEEGETLIRRKLRQFAAVFGAMRSYEMAEPAFATLTCRQVNATARFDRSGGLVTMQVCSDGGPWTVESFDVTPDVVTGSVFERAIQFELAEKWPGQAVVVSCPGTAVPVGGEIACRIEKGAERANVRVKRTSESGMAILGPAPE